MKEEHGRAFGAVHREARQLTGFNIYRKLVIQFGQPPHEERALFDLA
jgi:hypothetical protein